MHVLIPRFSEEQPRWEAFVQQAVPPYHLLDQGYVDKRTLIAAIMNRHPCYLSRYMNRVLNISLTLVNIGYDAARKIVVYKVLGPFDNSVIPYELVPPLSLNFTYMDLDSADKFPDLFETTKVEIPVSQPYRPKTA
jgi:hypothetical protein